MNIAKFLRTPILKNICERLLFFLFFSNAVQSGFVRIIQKQPSADLSHSIFYESSETYPGLLQLPKIESLAAIVRYQKALLLQSTPFQIFSGFLDALSG